jgi:protein SCO1/2
MLLIHPQHIRRCGDKGDIVTPESLRGRPYLVFFGFTHCPDICPTTLTELTLLYRKLGRDGDKITTLLITVDPERDTQDSLVQYMESFDSRFLAVRGTTEETDAAVKAFKAHKEKVPLQGGGYTMDHTAGVFMMDANGVFSGILDSHESEDVRLQKLRRLIAAR